MLRNTDALLDWIERDDPSVSVCRAVVAWVNGLAEHPWQAPSVPFPELSDQPNDEVRSAVVPGADGIEVFYRQHYALGVVDLIGVYATG